MTDRADTRHAIVRCGPGEGISQPRAGDILLIRGIGWVGRVIRFGQRMIHLGTERRDLVHWSHAALVVSRKGHLVEVVYNGVRLGRIEGYRKHDYHYVRLDLSEEDRANAVRYASSCVKQKYARMTFVLLTLARVFRMPLRITDWGGQGCIALIARALEIAGVTFDRPVIEMTPADLAHRLGVRP